MESCNSYRLAVLICMLLLAVSGSLVALNIPPLELSSGFSGVLYQNVFSMKAGSAVELAVATSISSRLSLQTGYRQGLDDKRGEGFARLLASPHWGIWQPQAGLELGISNRTNFTYDKMLLQEMQIATNAIDSPLYIAWVAAPLSFSLGRGYTLKAVDLQVGTHLSHLGRTMRVQLGIISIGTKL